MFDLRHNSWLIICLLKMASKLGTVGHRKFICFRNRTSKTLVVRDRFHNYRSINQSTVIFSRSLTVSYISLLTDLFPLFVPKSRILKLQNGYLWRIRTKLNWLFHALVHWSFSRDVLCDFSLQTEKLSLYQDNKDTRTTSSIKILNVLLIIPALITLGNCL